MSDRPTYEELAHRIEHLEQANLKLKRSVEELRQSEAHSRSFLTYASDAIFCYEYDPPIPITLPVEDQVRRLYDGKLVMCNDAAAGYYGHRLPEDVVGMKLCDLFGAVPGGPVDRLFDEFVRNGYRIFEGEGVEVLPDGSKRYFSNNAHGVVVDGSLVKVCGAYHDMTQYKLAEETLRRNEARMRSVFLVAPVGIGIVVDRIFQDVNSRFCRIIGYDRDELVGKSTRMVYPSDEVYEHAGREVQRQIEQLGTGIFEVRLLRKDGGIIDVLMGSTPLDPGNLSAGVTFTALDITERKSASEALRQSEKRFRDFVEMLPETVFEADMDLNLRFVNRQAYAMFGYTRQDFEKGLNGIDMIVPEERKRAHENVVKRLQGEVLGVHEYRGLRKDGSTFPFLFHMSPIVDHDRIEGFRGIIVDISERLKTEEQLRQAQKMESVGRLAGGVAHDFNNMLAVILGQTELMLQEVEPNQPIYTRLRDVRKAAKHSADITRQLLAFARKQMVNPQLLDLNERVEGTLRMIGRIIGEDIDLRWLPGRDLAGVLIDPLQIDQILANLCVNARDAITGTGILIIETDNVTLDEDYCSDHVGAIPGDYVMLAVSDNGCGMDHQTLEKLFEPFYTTKDIDKGTGLGLATVYGIVKQNNGFIDVNSEPGQGACFKVYFPQQQDRVEAPSEKSENSSTEQGRETILLVEDEAAILEMIRDMLENLGYLVMPAGTPQEAIRLAREFDGKIHLLLTDVVMPEMNGRVLSQNILSVQPDCKCLFMSGYSPDIVAHKGELDPGEKFIQKPFEMSELAAAIRGLIDAE